MSNEAPQQTLKQPVQPPMQIELQNVKKVYPVTGGEVVALDNISLKIRKGDIFGIIGLSGAGKSTLIRCINRLDRDTTGLIVLAKHALSAAVLSQAMRSREIHRTYQAFALGETAASGTIDAPIARLNGSLIQRTVDFASGERSVTHYRTLAHCSVFSHLELNLETGRTHQIRVHMAYIGHPLLGDTLYNKTPGTFPRQALHSASLSFVHPITGEPLNFHAPLPEDMQNLLT